MLFSLLARCAAATVLMLLEAGGDPALAQKTDGEGPFDVAKTDEVSGRLVVRGVQGEYA